VVVVVVGVVVESTSLEMVSSEATMWTTVVNRATAMMSIEGSPRAEAIGQVKTISRRRWKGPKDRCFYPILRR
jgi:hypothetical protein